MKHFFHIDEFHKIQSIPNDQNAHWIHLCDPSLEEIESLAKAYNFPMDFLTTGLDIDEVSRSEQVLQASIEKPALALLILTEKESKNNTDFWYTNYPISMVLLKDKLITLSKKEHSIFKELENNAFKIIRQVHHIHDIVFELGWQIVSRSVLASRDITSEMDILYQKSRRSSKSDLIYSLADLDRSAVYLAHATRCNQKVFEQLSKALFIIHHHKYQEWMHDIVIENHQAHLMIEQTRQILQQLDTTFSSIIQNNLNETMKILTSLTIIITIPSIIGSLWGMNVQLPFMNHPYAFLFIMISTMLLMAIVVIWLRRKDLL